MSQRRSAQETTTAANSADGLLGRRFLVVVGDGLTSTYPLPDDGKLLIGRGETCDIVIDHKSVSRRHAILRLGATISIEDLGSANETRVRDRPIKPHSPVTVPANEPIDIGSLLLIVRERSSPEQSRHLWAHGYFEERLEEECARGRRRGGEFGIIRVRAAGAETKDVEEGLAGVFRTSDVVGWYGASEYEVLLLDTSESELSALETRIRDALVPRGAHVSFGSAWFPKDGRNPHELLARAAPAALESSGPAETFDAGLDKLHRFVDRIASSPITVLIVGETGVGKEVMAQRIHLQSLQASGPFLGINCGALSEHLLESELFGHEKGAFTGASQAKPGLFEVATGGTVFLDEVGELTLPIQVKLLRVIEERFVLRVGGLKPRPIDVRFIAATNRDLEADIANGRFRQDLFFRLNGVTVDIPPLRKRVNEIPRLAGLFITQGAERMGLAAPTLSREALDLLTSYSWPGNIRELRNVMERAVLLSGGAEIRPEHLPREKMAHRIVIGSEPPIASLEAAPTAKPRARRASRGIEADQILDALAKCGGNQKKAAELLGVSRRSLINRIAELDLPRPRKRN